MNISPEFLDRLPETEKQIYELYCEKKIKQREVADILGVTQGAISSRLAKMKKRVDFMRDISVYDLKGLREKLSQVFGPLEVELLVGMSETTNQSDTAHRLNRIFNLQDKKRMNQVKVRHRYMKCLDRMKNENHPVLKEYLGLFQLISHNFCIMSEVKLPHFDRGTVWTEKK